MQEVEVVHGDGRLRMARRDQQGMERLHDVGWSGQPVDPWPPQAMPGVREQAHRYTPVHHPRAEPAGGHVRIGTIIRAVKSTSSSPGLADAPSRPP